MTNPVKKPGFARSVRETRFRYRSHAQQPRHDSSRILLTVAAVVLLLPALVIAQAPASGRGPSQQAPVQTRPSPAGPVQTGPAEAGGASLETHIRNLASIDYPTRMNAARMIRRVDASEAVAALREAIAEGTDQFVRYRAFILLSSFNDRQTGAMAKTLLTDRNDRLREAAYKWLEANPDPSLAATLLSALKTEVAEFVRPALVGALAALGGSNVQVQRALVPEVTRGVDFFRAAAIDSLGRHGATYAIDAIVGVSNLDGPLQDDAVLALGRIGGPRARAALTAIKSPPASLVPTLQAAQCLAEEERRPGVPVSREERRQGVPGDREERRPGVPGDRNQCEAVVKSLVDAASASGAPASSVRAALTGLSAIAASGSDAANRALVTLAARGGGLRDESALAFAAAAVRSPGEMLAWLDATADPVRTAAIDLLKQGFEDLEEDFGEEQFFAETRAYYWKVPEGSSGRTVASNLIQQLEF